MNYLTLRISRKLTGMLTYQIYHNLLAKELYICIDNKCYHKRDKFCDKQNDVSKRAEPEKTAPIVIYTVGNS